MPLHPMERETVNRLKREGFNFEPYLPVSSSFDEDDEYDDEDD